MNNAVMHIVHLIPGAGGSFYCQNCFKDTTLVRELRARGHEVTVVPMYLPSFPDAPDLANETPTFFGALNVTLKQFLPFWSRAPRCLQSLLDHPALLRLVARFSGSTRAEGLEEMTLSMLKGESGRQAGELRTLLAWLETVRPDVVHLSNALLLGLAKGIREGVGVPVVCSLQDETHWVDSMREPYRQQTWDLIGVQAASVDRFVAVSQSYADRVAKLSEIPFQKIMIIPAGVDPALYRFSSLPDAPAVIGYLSRMSKGFGVERLVQALGIIRKNPFLAETRLRICGGKTGEDDAFLQGVRREITALGLEKGVEFVEGVDLETRVRFLEGLTLLSVPMEEGDAIGTYLLEAFAAGVPVVQPESGGFPEVIEASGGGVLIEENTPKVLAAAIEDLLGHRERLEFLGKAARRAASTTFSVQEVAVRMELLYRELVTES
ncbi:MAG: glycosyltransferase family 4 protein [Planctomycetota bacterium]|jgi:glycosyltransferase involved in cell wall biosynthesis